MSKYASEVVKQARAWVGIKEGTSGHKEILDIYNSQKVLPRDYKMGVSVPWCAALVSAVAIKLGYTDIIPTECSCTKMIELFKKLGTWNESDSRTPKAGDIIFYDWNDNGKGDNTGSPDHVGIVEKVEDSTITVIEGNYDDSVKRRTLAVNGKYIRGYGVPKYDEEVKKETDIVIKVTPAIELLANEIIQGKWFDNTNDRRKESIYASVQSLVTKKMNE